MFFTPDQLSTDPELRPVVWTSEHAFQRERHHLFTQLASCLHSQATSPTTSTANLLSSSNQRNSDAKSITTLSSKTSASTLLESCSRRLISPFLASASPSTKFKPVTFSSPQTSVFRFDAAAAAASSTAAQVETTPSRVDSVMGSPLKLLSPAMLKRKKKIISAAGKLSGHFAAVKEAEIFNYFRMVGDKGGKSGGGEGSSNDKEGKEVAEMVVEDVVVKNDIDDKGVKYVEYLGLAVAAEPKSIEEQYRFVKGQLQKSRDLGFKVEGGQKTP